MITRFLHETKRLLIEVECLLLISEMLVTVADVTKGDTESEWFLQWAPHFQHAHVYIQCALILTELRISRSEIADQHGIDIPDGFVDRRRAVVHRETILSVA